MNYKRCTRGFSATLRFHRGERWLPVRWRQLCSYSHFSWKTRISTVPRAVHWTSCSLCILLQFSYIISGVAAVYAVSVLHFYWNTHGDRQTEGAVVHLMIYFVGMNTSLSRSERW